MLDRESAAKLNPIISTSSVCETLDNVCAVVGDLALLPDSAEHAGVTLNRFDFLALAVRAAVTFEVETMRAESEAKP